MESFWERFGRPWRVLGHFELIFKVHFSTIFLLFFVPRLPGAKNVKLGFEKEVPREDLEGFGDDFG